MTFVFVFSIFVHLDVVEYVVVYKGCGFQTTKNVYCPNTQDPFTTTDKFANGNKYRPT